MVPNGWETHHLEELSTKISDGIHTTPKYADSSSVYFVNGNNLKNGQIVIQESTKFVDEVDAEKHRKELSERTILMSINGTIGNLAYYRGENVVLGKSACFINVKKNVDVDFIYNVLNSDKTQAFYTSELTGSTIKNLSLKTIKLTKVNLPPLPEQQKIAKILSTWDKAIATTEKLIATSQKQKKGLMQQLLTGKKRLVNPETGKVFEGDWEVQHLENVTTKISDGIHTTPEYVEKSPIYFVNGNNLKNGKIVIQDSTKCVEEKNAKQHRRELSDRTILMSINGTIGNLAYYCGENVVLGKSACYINVDVNTDVNFIFYILSSEMIQTFYTSELTGSTIKNLSLKTIKLTKVHIPSLLEQSKIASVLTAADKEIELLQAKLTYLKDEKKALMQQLLTGKRRVKVDESVAA